ncbi:MAG TPA: hypothetical protein VLU43_11745 [Anaeromyxobacteraceae bacterium]|nr:hypothetical protein [Anaeromyxobacteraceae bacterium]
MKRTALVAVVSGLLLSACATEKPAAKTHYSVVPDTQVTVREKKPSKHTNYTVQPAEEYVSGSAGH